MLALLVNENCVLFDSTSDALRQSDSKRDNHALREPYDRIIRCLGFKFNETLFSP